MLEDIKKFYDKVRLRKVEWNIEDNEMPITFLHIFKKSYPRLPFVELPISYSESKLEEILKLRESTREFSDESMCLNQIAKILNSVRIIDRKREPERRTYPSAGARFPVETYLIVYNLTDLNKGVYHYNIDKNSLELLWQKNIDEKRLEITGTNILNPAATIVLTSVISRSEVKYWHKALPFSYIEAGHIGQNIILSCAENGIGACPVSGFLDDTLIDVLDLTDGEIPVYTINIGKKKEL